ncbi:hypothetical protein G5714_012963 [Onychostoma macrolepis]|uniref:THAP domain-containing protein 1 n=1 Tax=Onychostoma macrolepis TaxID=369639 RepID=A0A7J6CKD4_9TELE|nr:hypothetical protein G5714_012963 [Onychostoma macrolepis]
MRNWNELLQIKDLTRSVQTHRKAPRFMTELYDAVVDSNGTLKNTKVLEGNIVRSFEGDKVTAHKFPLTNPERLKLWLIALHLDINTPLLSLEQKRVCSDHFLDDDYRPSEQGKPRLLKSSSVPITFLKQEKYSYHENPESLATQNEAAGGPGSWSFFG